MRGLSLIVLIKDCSLLAVPGLLTAVASLAAEQGLRHPGTSVVVVQGLSCPVACRILLTRARTCPLHWQASSKPLNYESSSAIIFNINSALVERSTTYHSDLLFSTIYYFIVWLFHPLFIHLQIVTIQSFFFNVAIINKVAMIILSTFLLVHICEGFSRKCF